MASTGSSATAEEETQYVNDLDNNEGPGEEDTTARDAPEVPETDNKKLADDKSKIEQNDRRVIARDRTIARLRDQFSRDTADFKAELEKQKKRIDEYEKENKRLKTFEDNQLQLIQEINRLKGFEAVYPAHVEHIHKLENQLKTANNAGIKLENDLHQAENQKKSLNGVIQALRKDIHSLEEEKQHLLLRLSKLAGAKLTLDNPNIADLSDSKRPTKLAEEFAELYDNEWTDAFEELTADNEQQKTAFMVKLLQRASEICCEVSSEHMNGIKRSVCTLTVYTNSQTKMQVGRNTNVTMDTGKETNLTNSKRFPRDTHQNPTEPHGPSMVHSHGRAADDSIESTIEDEYEVIDSSDLVTYPQSQVKSHEITFDFNDLPSEQRKTVNELRKFVEISLSDKLKKDLCEIIVRENDIDQQTQEKFIKYVKNCVNLCWSMCQHDPPVFISFPTVQGDMHLDTNIYKPYTKTGKLIDFIVWPALYLHENGPLLSKGVAQGRA